MYVRIRNMGYISGKSVTPLHHRCAWKVTNSIPKVKIYSPLYMIRSEKTDQQVKCILLLHIIDTFIYYSKHSDKIARGGQVCFSTWLFLAMQNTEKPVQMVKSHHPSTPYKRHSWYYGHASKSLPKSSRVNYQW